LAIQYQGGNFDFVSPDHHNIAKLFCFKMADNNVVFLLGKTIGYNGFRDRERQTGAGSLLLANSCCKPSLGEGDNKSRIAIDRETMFNA
jgi:hypothetical protein